MRLPDASANRRNMKTHKLKVHPSIYRSIVSKVKTWEIRKNDRDFDVGDHLQLREYDPGPCGDYTGQSVIATVMYIMHGGRFGIPEGYCIMSIRVEA